MSKTSLAQRFILALDVDSYEKAKYFISSLKDKIKIFKVGPVLFSACGHRIIKLLKENNLKVFLDLKLFDIPHTVASTLRVLTRLGIDMVSLHIQGGEEMLRQARQASVEEAKKIKSSPPLLLGVTVLTSQKNKDKIKLHVLSLAKKAKRVGLEGVICSVRELSLLRRQLGKDFLLVTPGIREEKIPGDDQRRVATPKEAILQGADYLVIGRPLLEAKDPREKFSSILRSVYGS
jgi:orotidine-5'-phosphate decarboxylase